MPAHPPKNRATASLFIPFAIGKSFLFYVDSGSRKKGESIEDIWKQIFEAEPGWSAKKWPDFSTPPLGRLVTVYADQIDDMTVKDYVAQITNVSQIEPFCATVQSVEAVLFTSGIGVMVIRVLLPTEKPLESLRRLGTQFSGRDSGRMSRKLFRLGARSTLR